MSLQYHILYPPDQTISMTDLFGFFTHSLPHHTTRTTHTQTHTISHLIIQFVLFGYHTLRNCCSTTSIKFLPTSQLLSHFLRVDSQFPLTGAGIGLTPPRPCCVTQVNRFKLGHLACDLANAFGDLLVNSPTQVATETSVHYGRLIEKDYRKVSKAYSNGLLPSRG